MIGTIRKHQQWLWAVIIVAIIISFVYYFSPTSKLDTGRRAGNYGSINGQPVSEEDYFNALRETELHTFVTTGRWPSEDKKRTEQETMRDIYQWLLLVQKEDQLGIHPADEVLEQLARQLIQPLERLGVPSPVVFVEKVLPMRGYTVADFERFVRHYAGIQELILTAGLSGKLVTPEETRAFYTLETEAVATTPVFFSASNYLAAVTASPDALAQFYSNRLASYRIPERVQVSYVMFSASNFTAQAEARLKTNLAEVVEASFRRLGTNAPVVFPEAKTPEAVKAKIREEILRREALQDARKKALEFGGVLEAMEPRSAENLQTLASSNHLNLQVSAPFGRDEPPKDIEAGSGFAKRAFELTAQDPFAGPIVGQDAIYEIALKEKLPSRIPSLEEIRDEVTADYKFNQALLRARVAAMAFHNAATNGLVHGKAFSAICAEAKVTPVTVPPISISTRELPELEGLIGLDQIKHAAFSIAPGQVSNLYPTSDGSMVLYVKEKLPVDMAKMNSELPEFTRVLRQRRQQEAFNQWLSRESERGLRDTPIFQQQQPPPTMQPASKAKS